MMVAKKQAETSGDVSADDGNKVGNGIEGEKVGVKPARSGKPSLLSTLFNGLDEAHSEAAARVENLEAELIEARRDLSAVMALKMIREGGELPLMGGQTRSPVKPRQKAAGGSSGSGSSGPRGEVPKAVLDALTKAGKSGLSRGELLEQLSIGSDDKSGQTSVSNALSSGKRAGKYLHHEDGRYSLNA